MGIMAHYSIDDFAAGGYFLTKYTGRADCMSSDLLPPRIISASDCIVDIVPDAWAVEWAKYNAGQRKREAAKAGIPPDVLPQVIQWVTSRLDHSEIGWPVVFYSADVARHFARKFLPNDDEIVLIGVGLQRDLVNEFLEEEKPSTGHGVPGVYEALSRGESLEAGGEVLGFEVLGYEWGGFHSWLCNGLEVDGYREFKIRPNSHGFIATLEEAAMFAEYASREEVGAEPALWRPWLVVKYPVKI
jgi:hypothetical protein